MNIINHGTWALYRPETLPKDAPANALFAKRQDGTDWYDYAKAPENFKDLSIKLTLYGDRVGAATRDATKLWPAGATVLEIRDSVDGDPQMMFGGKVFDAATNEFHVKQEEPRVDPLEELRARIAALEAKG